MNKVLCAALPALLPVMTLLAAPLAAQKDSIVLKDGTVLDKVKVTKWTAKEIAYRSSSGAQTKPAHLVESATVERVKDALARATDAAALIGEAEANKSDALIAASALYNAAMMFYDANDDSSMISALQRIDTEFPDSPFAPEFFRKKIVYYLSQPKPKLADAAKTALSYGDASRTRVWSPAYQLDAELWAKRIERLAGKMPADRYISAMQDLINKASSTAPFVAHAAAVELGDAYRAEKKYDEAKKVYVELGKKKGLDANVAARMYLGLGYISLENAIASKEKSDYHEAFKNFLRVYINAKKANPNLVAEGLYNAAKACEQWGELPSCRIMAGRLRGRLKLRAPYNTTVWANKK